jgi:hypothetical protein
MGETLNIANAFLLIGVGYLYLVHHLDLWITVGAVILAVVSWSYHGFTDERKKYFKAQIALIEAKTSYYKSRTRADPLDD